MSLIERWGVSDPVSFPPVFSFFLPPSPSTCSTTFRAAPCHAMRRVLALSRPNLDDRRNGGRASSIFAQTRNSSSRAGTDDATTEARIHVRETFRDAVVPLARTRVASIQLAVLAVDLYGRRRGRFTVNIAR